MTDPLVAEGVDRILASTCTPEVVARSEDEGWCAPVWDALAAGGFPWVSVPEEAGGSGGTVADAVAVLTAVGRHAAPVPVAETGLLGGWLLATAGLALPDGPCSVVATSRVLGLSGGRVSGCGVVPWASKASKIVALVKDVEGWLVVAADRRALGIEPARNMAGEPRDRVHWNLDLEAAEHGRVDEAVASAFELRGALSRAAMAAGALETLCRLTVNYAHERRQFGRPIAGFQAVQQHLVTVAECAARAALAVELAAVALDAGGGEVEVAAARVVVDRASVEGAAAAHQVHGAMGLTREYPLQLYTRRLHAWRHEFGSGGLWRRRLGGRLGAVGADALFPTLTRSPSS